jgi:hypothetical protein
MSGAEVMHVLVPWFHVLNANLEDKLLHAVAAVCRMPMLPADRGAVQAIVLELAQKCCEGQKASKSRMLLAVGLARAVISGSGLLLWSMPDATLAPLQVRLLW